MDVATYHKYLTAVKSNGSPAADEEIVEVEGSLRRQLRDSKLFTSIDLDHTRDQDSLVIALCDFRPGVSSEAIAEHLEDIWRMGVTYPQWEVHAAVVEEDLVEFEAATRLDRSGRYVTLRLVARPSFVPSQRGVS
jgi:hypothetical protein